MVEFTIALKFAATIETTETIAELIEMIETIDEMIEDAIMIVAISAVGTIDIVLEDSITEIVTAASSAMAVMIVVDLDLMSDVTVVLVLAPFLEVLVAPVLVRLHDTLRGVPCPDQVLDPSLRDLVQSLLSLLGLLGLLGRHDLSLLAVNL